MAVPGENILMFEIPCLEGSPAWIASKKSLFNMCKFFWNKYVGIINAGFYMQKAI